MPELNLDVYVNALFILMISSISAFIIVIRKIDSDEVPAISLNYYNLYFIVGVIGWIGLWIKDAANIYSDLSLAVVFYIVASYFLLIAIVECTERTSHKKMVSLAHLCLILISFLLDNDTHRILFLSAYSLLIYPVIFNLSFKRARDRNNIGNSIISVAALLTITIVPFQLYLILVSNDFSSAYGISLIGSSTGFVLVGIGFLTSVLVAEHRKLTQLALNDPLTGLYNRRGMDFSINISLASSQRLKKCFSAINIDIDFFKKINDTYGHDGGDYVLKEIADVLLQHVRSGDVCSRLGGEEFVILLPETTKDYAIEVAERIRKNIEMLELTYNGQIIKLTSSFGVATHSGEINIDHLLKDADKALYSAKAEGRNKVCVATSD